MFKGNGGFIGKSGITGRLSHTGIRSFSGLQNAASYLLAYDFKQTDLSKAVREQVKGVDTISQANVANRHILQSDGTVQTFAPNEVAFRVGEGVVSQGVATNRFSTSDSSGNTLARYTRGTQEERAGVKGYAYEKTESVSGGFYERGISAPAGGTVYYFHIDPSQIKKVYVRANYEGAIAGGITSTLDVESKSFSTTNLDPSKLIHIESRLLELGESMWRVALAFELISDTNDVIAGCYFEQENVGDSFWYGGQQLTSGLVISSLVVSTGSPATRPADVTKAPITDMVANDFTHTHKVKMQGNAADYLAITDIGSIATAHYYIDPDSPSQVSFAIDGSGDPVTTVTLPSPILAGDTLAITLTKSSTEGTTLSVNGVSATQATATTSLTLAPDITLGNGFIHQSLNDKAL